MQQQQQPQPGKTKCNEPHCHPTACKPPPLCKRYCCRLPNERPPLPGPAHRLARAPPIGSFAEGWEWTRRSPRPLSNC
ncbi:hypothetical protein E2C01_055925 [Portunus trituberculatus]|uniref:Uncharacterized protein n=1 Tax=Portunus trituberculatus TaxID=210409 RepID=A0A5B7GWI8_PORTR|nr:hypothetical protein [Portunus trituberculatus]